MKALPHTDELDAVARRCVWFRSPVEALADLDHLVAHVLTFGMQSDVRTLRKHLTDAELAHCLESAPAGVFDDRSWAYWNWMLRDLRIPPPLPQRTFAA